MTLKALLLAFCLQATLGYDCAEDETFVEKNIGRKLGITQFDLEDWSVKYVEFVYLDHRTVACMNNIQPGWKLKKLQIDDVPQYLQTNDILTKRGIEATLQNPDVSLKMCFDTKEEKARFYTGTNDVFFNVEKSHALIEYDWSNWTVKLFRTTNIIGDMAIEKGSFPRVKPGWKIANVHFWNKIQDKWEFFNDPETHKDSASIKARLMSKVPHTITFQKRALDSNHYANEMSQPKNEGDFFGKDAYIMHRSVKDGTGQVYEGKVFENYLNYQGKGTEYIFKYKDSSRGVQRDVDRTKIWLEMPTCHRCNKPGHYGPFCPTLKCFICSKVGHSNRQCAEGIMCARCNQSGHYPKECPNVPQCRNCWKLGHSESECPNELFCYNCCRTGHSKYSRECPKALAEQRSRLQRKTVENALNEALRNKHLNTSPFSRSNSKNFDSTEERKSLQGKSVDYNRNETPEKFKTAQPDTPLSRSNSKKIELAQNGCLTSPSSNKSWKFLIPQSSPKNHQNQQDSVKKSEKEKTLKALGIPPKSFRKLSYKDETSKLSPGKKIAPSSSNKHYTSKDLAKDQSTIDSIFPNHKKSQKEKFLDELRNPSKSSRKYKDESSKPSTKKDETVSPSSNELKRKRSESDDFEYEEIYGSPPQNIQKGLNAPRSDYQFPEIFALIKKEVDEKQNFKQYSYQPEMQPDVVCLNDQVSSQSSDQVSSQSSDGDDKEKISKAEKTKYRSKSSIEGRPEGVRKIPQPLYIDHELDQIKQNQRLVESFRDIYEPDTSQTNPTKRQSSAPEIQQNRRNEQNDSSKNSSPKNKNSSKKE